MKKNEIKIGGLYTAKVSGKLTTVKVTGIRKRQTGYGPSAREGTVYDVINQATGRKTTFASAMKFRSSKELKADQKKRDDAEGPSPTQKATSGFTVAQKSMMARQAGIPYTADELAKMESEEAAKQPADPTESVNGRPATISSDATSMPSKSAEPTSALTTNLSTQASSTAPPTSSMADRLRAAKIDVDNAPHLIIEARAGTGKTTTLICGIAYMFRNREVV